MINYNNFYDICHEHLSYYSIETFEKLLKNFNLRCFYAETNSVNGGSIRLFVCRKNTFKKYSNDEFESKLKMLKEEESNYKLKNSSTYLEFQKIIDNIKNKTVSFVNDIIKSKKQVFALGPDKGKYLTSTFWFK